MFSKVTWGRAWAAGSGCGIKLMHRLLDVFVDGGHEVVGGDKVAAKFKAGEATVHATGQVLGHAAVFDGGDAHLLDGMGELDEVGVVVQAATVLKTTGPGEDGGDWVGGGLVALLVLTVVTGDGAVGGLGFDGLSIGSLEDGGHHAEGSESLGERVGLDVSVVVLAGPDESSLGLEALGDHVVDESVLVPDALRVESGLVLGLVDFFEDVLESSVVSLHDRVLGRHVEWPLLLERHLEGGFGETGDRLVGVVHAHQDTSLIFEVKNFHGFGGGSVGGGEDDFELAGLGGDVIGGAVLVAKSVTADADWLLPAGHEEGNVLAHDWLAEDDAVEDVTDGAVGRLPHRLQLEFLDTLLVGGDGGALDGDVVLQGGVGGVDGDLIVGLVSVFHAEIVVLEVDVAVGEDHSLTDLVPDDAGHLVSVHFDHGLGHLDATGACGRGSQASLGDLREHSVRQSKSDSKMG